MKPNCIIITSKDEVYDASSGPFAIARLLGTQHGRTTLAASMVNPIRRNLDYQSLSRKIFNIQPMPPGAMPIYTRSSDDDDE